MKVPFFKKKLVRFVANICFFSLVYQLVFPVTTYALTSGPSQPEMQSFEPVGTTDMVNMFSGDFNYNIPLLDVEGYPVNIYYHAGPTVEQEASWVGLGWNINPGNINHIVRGFSDDYNGDIIEKKLKIEKETNKYFNVFFGVEAAGLSLDKIFGAAAKALQNAKISGGGQLNFGMNFNNYTGVSASVGASGNAGVSTRAANTEMAPWISAGMNMGATISTDKGVDVDYSFSGSSSMSRKVNGDVYGSAGVGVSAGGGMNSREGMKYTFWGINASLGVSGSNISQSVTGGINETYIPAGLQTYIPVITNATSMSSMFFQLKVGGEAWSLYPFGGGGYGENAVEVKEDGSKKAYGYFNLGNASGNDIVDFAREKDGNINRATKYLPLPTMTYDIYSVSGQGTGGSFRPYRNDVGTVHDPELGSESSTQSHLGEAGLGNLLEGGYDLKTARTNAHSGPWSEHSKKFTQKKRGSFYEPYFIKQAGELTPRNEVYHTNIKQKDLLSYAGAKGIGNTAPPNSRVSRANLLYFLSADEASRRHVSLLPKLENYDFDGFTKKANWEPEGTQTQDRYKLLNRVDGPRKAHQASEFTQVQPDGQRYIYGLPVMNIYQKDYEIGVAASTSQDEFDLSHHRADFTGYATGGLPNHTSQLAHSSKTVMPSYAHSYMLTAVLSPDYVDITGNGITEDDLGTYTKFNYRKRENYKWRVPYDKLTAQRNRGLKSDCKDDKASFSGGEREQWILHSIESRNFVAEFYTTERKDAEGADATEAIYDDSDPSKSYKLDSIALYNKWDRFNNELLAEPIQTVVFSYDYSLCKELPNNSLPDPSNPSKKLGKLTLKSIFIKKGNSKIGYLSPYQFKYATDATQDQRFANPKYDVAAKDCWGSYKPKDGNNKPTGQNVNLNNFEYPYVNQNDTEVDSFSRAWNLEEIILPSGGKIKVTYEADDYAYVQDKKAMEMFRVEGVGPGKNFTPNNSLYQSATNPYLYVYFKRKITAEHNGDIASSYLDGNNIIQFNFDVLMSSGTAASCSSTPLTESVKGYAKVVESGICDNTDYGYLKLEARNANTAPQLSAIGIPGAKLNPITLAAINFGRYHAPKVLNPEMDMPTGSGKALINAFKSAIGDFASFFQNQLKTYLNKGKAQTFTIGKSYIRLVSQGLKKKGGGHRVKKLEFIDNWAGIASETKYGSEYDYTIPLPGTNKKISSGVASYEPLFGGNENPCRTLMVVNEIGNSSKFPAADPIELQQEHPIGETMYPPASVGYSKITVTSIHKNAGESSQTIQEFEHYTAKDFPIKTIQATPLEVLEDKKPKFWEIFNKTEVYRLAQGYTMELNDMHGKLKQTTTWVAKHDASDSRELVSYTRYNYFTSENNSLNNNIPCLEFDVPGKPPKLITKTLGEDVELTVDTREKEEKTSFRDFHFSANSFLMPPVPIIIPIGFPKNKKQSKTFSTFVNSKIIQKYGVIQSVESYNKGALVKAENIAFDPSTGEALITSVNTEYDDKEYTIKYPAYWAYRNMGAAYENILFEEELQGFDYKNEVGSRIRDDVGYLHVQDINKYNIGDELELSLDDLCANATGAEGKKYKAWVVDKGPFIGSTWSCSTQGPTCIADATHPIKYRGYFYGNNPSYAWWNDGDCITEQQLKGVITDLMNDNEIGDLQNSTIEHCHVFYYSQCGTQSSSCPSTHIHTYRASYDNGTCASSCTLSFKGDHSYTQNAAAYGTTNEGNQKVFDYYAVIDPSTYSGPMPSAARYRTTISFRLDFRGQKQENSSNDPFVDLNVVGEDKPTIPHGLMSLSIWSDSPPNTFNNPCAYFNKNTTTQQPSYENYDIDDIVTAPNPPCSAYLKIRGGIWARVTSIQTQDMWTKPYLIVKPYKKDAVPTDLTASNTFPENDDIIKGSVKVVRSGKRNYLNETLQQTVVNEYPILTNSSNPANKDRLKTAFTTIHSTASTFTDVALVPDDINSDYFNPFVTGQRGNYRTKTTYLPTPKRQYPDGGNNNQSDRYKGTYLGFPLWGFSTSSTYNDKFYNRMYIPMGYQYNWRENTTYNYSAWGRPVTAVDALGRSNIILYDFDNKVASATVTNAGENEAIYESFEDAFQLYKYDNNPIRNFFNPLRYYANPLKLFLKTEITTDDPGNSNYQASSYVEVLTDSHSGKYAMKFKQNTDINLEYTPAMYGLNLLQRFYVFTDRKYIVSCWQKTGTNGSSPPVHSGVEIKWGTSILHKALLTAKTPSIDGWVLYEGEVTVPASASFLKISIAANSIIDDFRLLPAESNMKAYVYDDVYRRISATLDENHLATFFEYDNQGKLIRIKKETEKGILTIKESRESLKELISSYPY